MEVVQIEERLKLGEDSSNEFKGVARRDFSIDTHDVARTLAAFANSGGGRLFLGVEDDGTVTGVGDLQQADKLMLQVSQVAADAVGIACPIDKVDVRGQLVLVVRVPGFTAGRPYLYRSIAYVRDANRSRPATRDEQIRLLQSADDVHFDEQPVRDCTRAELRDEAVEEFVTASYDPVEVADQARDALLRALKCLDSDGTPTVTGVLFFGKDPQRFLPDARISALRFHGTEPGDEARDAREIGGRLPDQIERAMEFLDRHLLRPWRIEGLTRVDGGIPERVLREALVNAVVHRDYGMTAQVRLFVFDDRIEITNPGGLLNRMTPQSIRMGLSQRRNPAVSSLLAKIRRREAVGAGILTMFRLMRERGLPEPEIQVEGGHFLLRLSFGGQPLA